MPDLELVNYIRDAQELGVSNDEIILTLVDSGWEEMKVYKLITLMESDF